MKLQMKIERKILDILSLNKEAPTFLVCLCYKSKATIDRTLGRFPTHCTTMKIWRKKDTCQSF